jgi:hypothetical protein
MRIVPPRIPNESPRLKVEFTAVGEWRTAGSRQGCFGLQETEPQISDGFVTGLHTTRWFWDPPARDAVEKPPHGDVRAHVGKWVDVAGHLARERQSADLEEQLGLPENCRVLLVILDDRADVARYPERQQPRGDNANGRPSPVQSVDRNGERRKQERGDDMEIATLRRVVRAV